jgi:glyoxylase-like metal-dependent hydrolase (beta-lactamase superfamily II)
MERYELGPDIFVHTHASGEGGLFANAYLIESGGGLVAVDATLTESESKALRREVEALGKPLLAVLVTHPHPDHVAGITNLVGPDSPKIIATQAVLDLMRTLEEPKRAQWMPTFGDEWVTRWTYPDTVAQSGEQFTFDGVVYSVLDTGAGGDADQNSVWFVESPRRTAFIGDLVFNGTHPYVADGHLLAWLANLTRTERLCEEEEFIFPGHGAAGSPRELISAQRDYLLTYAAHLKELSGGKPLLSETALEELEARMTAAYPGAGLTFLIKMGADPVVRELNPRGRVTNSLPSSTMAT